MQGGRWQECQAVDSGLRGAVSELTAITQYIHGESCMCCGHCTDARMLLGIAMAEMIHLPSIDDATGIASFKLPCT